MSPLTRQRLLILIAAVLAGLLYLQGTPVARAADGTDGATLLFAASPVEAVGLFVILSVPVALLGAVVAAAGSSLGGAFVIAAALLFPAIRGGSIDEWLRGVDSSAAYWGFVIEALLWAALISAAALVCHLGRFLRPYLPGGFLTAPREESEPVEGTVSSAGAGRVSGHWFWTSWWVASSPKGGMLAPPPAAGSPERQRIDALRAWAGGTVSLVIGGIAAALLVRSADIGQVVGGLGIAFLISGVLAHQFFPASNPLPILLSPLPAGAIWYAWAAVTGGEAEPMLRGYFTGDFPHAALALPIHYASAGVAGAALGLGWSHSLLAAHPHEAEPPDTDPAYTADAS